MGTPSRMARYSGSERPACRMNQTGVRSTGSRRAARTRSLVLVALVALVARGVETVVWTGVGTGQSCHGDAARPAT
jgi:hypothetical protein